MQNLFSFPLIIDELTPAEKKYHLKASAGELAYIAEILKVPGVKNFEAEISVKPDKKNHRIDVWGKVKAEIEQTSVISLENFVKTYEPEFAIFYDTELSEKDLRGMEFELDDEVPDIIVGGKIDLAEIAMEQAALALDDFPRKEGETFQFKSEFDEETTMAANPFASLAKLKK